MYAPQKKNHNNYDELSAMNSEYIVSNWLFTTNEVSTQRIEKRKDTSIKKEWINKMCTCEKWTMDIVSRSQVTMCVVTLCAIFSLSCPFYLALLCKSPLFDYVLLLMLVEQFIVVVVSLCLFRWSQLTRPGQWMKSASKCKPRTVLIWSLKTTAQHRTHICVYQFSNWCNQHVGGFFD